MYHQQSGVFSSFFIDRLKSFMYMRNKKDPKIEPCGTSYLMVWISDLSLLMVASWVLSFWTNQKLLLWCHNGLVWKKGYHDWQCQRLSAALWRHHRQSCLCQEHFLHFKSMISWIIISKTKLIGKRYFIFSEKVS